MKKNSRFRIMILLHLLLMFYSTSGIFSKLASKESFLSFKFCLYYAVIIGILGIYAIGWQQVIKHIDLTVAYANKSVTIAWGIVWGALAFREQITPKMVIGATIVVAGAVLYSFADKMYENKHETLTEVAGETIKEKDVE